MRARGHDAVGACTLLGLGDPWAPALTEHLGAADGDGRWSADQVRTSARRLLTRFDEVSVADLRTLARATTSNDAAADIRTSARLRVLALTVALAIAGDDAGWRGRRGATSLTLLRCGLAAKDHVDSAASTLLAFDALWLDGAARDDIAAALRLSRAATERHAKDAVPPRWGYQAVTRHLGWSPDNLRLRRNNGTFATPDGTDRGKDWWWPDTIDAWADTAALSRCPDCGARVAKLPQHRRVHTDTASSTR